MSVRANVAIAARITVAAIAPIDLLAWIRQNPANCVTDYDHPIKIVAIVAVAISALPLAIRAFGRRTDDGALGAGREPHIGDEWTVPDVGLVMAMIAMLLFIQSGQGRAVVYDGCGIIGPAGTTIPGL